ncbi:MAG TPA: DUF4389 domain-containing protein [Chloroflexota bacterium]
MQAPLAPYPATIQIDYPDRLDRLTTFFRIFTAIPIVIVLSLLFHPGSQAGRPGTSADWSTAGIGVLFLPVLLLIVFRQKYPRWWFDWNLELMRFSLRVAAYLALLGDRYPSTDEEQAVHVDLVYPGVRVDLNRWLPLVKWFLAIPHYIVLFFLYIGAVVAVIIAWFAILFTASYPRGLFDYVVGVMRWHLRVVAYAFLLITDRYPPFRLGE